LKKLMAGNFCRTSVKKLIIQDFSSTTTSKLSPTSRKFCRVMICTGYVFWQTERLTRSTHGEMGSSIAMRFKNTWSALLTPRSCRNPQTSRNYQRHYRILKWVFIARHSSVL
jgi:hypothetical protein